MPVLLISSSSRSRAAAVLFGAAALVLTGQAFGSAPMPMTILARSAAPVALQSRPTVIPLAFAGRSLAARADGLAPGRSLYLVVRGLTATAQPGVLYSVYLDLPDGEKPAADDPRRVGIVQFYNARPPGAPNGPDAESPVNTDAEKVFFSFDLTPAIRALRQRGQLAERTTLTFLPDGSPVPGAAAVVRRLELVEQ